MANLIPYGTQVTYLPDRTALIPVNGEVLTGSWARKIAVNQIRALGWAGTIIVTPPDIYNTDVTATVYLPLGAYGTFRPPMIYVFPQFGSVVYYKNFLDLNWGFTQKQTEYDGVAVRNWDLRTWVDYLTYTATTIGGQSGNQWMFVIRHRCVAPIQPSLMWGQGWDNVAFAHSEWPHLIPGMGIVLHWRALGVDTSS